MVTPGLFDQQYARSIQWHANHIDQCAWNRSRDVLPCDRIVYLEDCARRGPRPRRVIKVRHWSWISSVSPYGAPARIHTRQRPTLPAWLSIAWRRQPWRIALLLGLERLLLLLSPCWCCWWCHASYVNRGTHVVASPARNGRAAALVPPVKRACSMMPRASPRPPSLSSSGAHELRECALRSDMATLRMTCARSLWGYL